MTPVVDGEVFHFEANGLYNGMPLLYDEETQSRWDHITGECLYGPSQGKRLQTSLALPLTVYQAYTMYPHLQIAIAKSAFHQKALSRVVRRWGRFLIAPLLSKYKEIEDTRLPRFEIGLGAWVDHGSGYVAKFYRMKDIREREGVLFDRLGKRQLLIYLDPQSKTPGAFFTKATAAFWVDGRLHLEDGLNWHDGLVYDDRGEVREVERPLQMFSRWYGFSFTFADCDIYGFK